MAQQSKKIINDEIDLEGTLQAIKERIDALSKKYGTTFTPELVAKLKEVV